MELALEEMKELSHYRHYRVAPHECIRRRECPIFHTSTHANTPALPLIRLASVPFSTRNSTMPTLGPDGLPVLPDIMNVMFLPLWVPTSLLKFVGSAPALLDADIEAVKSQVSKYLLDGFPMN